MNNFFRQLTQKFQLLRFGIVGITALCVHMLSVFILVPVGIIPLVANVIGFLIAFQVSFWGHARWTFNVKNPNSRSQKIKFFSVALGSFAVNEFFYFILLDMFHLNYQLALVIVLFGVAVLTFFLSKLWAFKE